MDAICQLHVCIYTWGMTHTAKMFVEFVHIMNRSLHRLKLHVMVAIIIMVPEAEAAVESYCSHVYIQV